MVGIWRCPDAVTDPTSKIEKRRSEASGSFLFTNFRLPSIYRLIIEIDLHRFVNIERFFRFIQCDLVVGFVTVEFVTCVDARDAGQNRNLKAAADVA